MKQRSNITGCSIVLIIDFAKHISQGKVIGIDIKEEQVNLAKKNAPQHLNNLSFQQADINRLPFQDNTFDVVFTHAVLCHVKDPSSTIKELKRVVKPGGIVASREMDWGALLIYPEDHLLYEAAEMREKYFKHLGFNYRIGRELNMLYTQEGFSPTIPSASCVVTAGLEKRHEGLSYAEIMAAQWEQAPFSKFMIANKWITDKQKVNYQKALMKFNDTPGAFRCWTWCEIIAFKNGC